MITKNPMQLKAFIKNKAAEKHISAQLVMQNYMPNDCWNGFRFRPIRTISFSKVDS